VVRDTESERNLTMADAFTQLGISRRPADVLFGRPDLSGGTAAGWSSAAVAQDEADKVARDEEQARADARAAQEDARAEAARVREGEAAADAYINAEPSNREKFLGNPALVGSKRFKQIAQFQQLGPSHADKTLQNQIALRIEHPDDQKIFHEAVAAGEGTWVGKQKADENKRNREFDSSLAAVGVHPKVSEGIRLKEGNSDAVREFHVSKNKMENDRGKDPEANRLRELYKNASEMATHSAKMDPTGMGQADPELVKRMLAHGNALDTYLSGKAKPAAPVGAGTVLAPPPAAAPAGAPLKNTLRSMAPAASAPKPESLPLGSAEEEQQVLREEINNPDNDENSYSNLIANPNVPLADKQAALAKLRAYVANPKPDPTLTLPQVFARREELRKKLAEAEEEVKFHPEREQFNRAWDTSKAGIDGIVERTAAKLGVSKQNLINSLVAGDKIEIPGRENDRGGISIPQMLAEQWKEELPGEFDKPHQIWSTEARPLTPFKNSPFAARLGTKVGPVPLRQTWGDVLDAYVKDQVSAAPAARPATPAAPLKIKSITPLN